jgi:hypothetical protein
VSVLPQHGFLGSLVAVGSADEGLVPFAGVDAAVGEAADLAGSASRRETTRSTRPIKGSSVRARSCSLRVPSSRRDGKTSWSDTGSRSKRALLGPRSPGL